MARLTRYFQTISWIAMVIVLSVYIYIASDFFSEGKHVTASEAGIYFDTFSVERGTPLQIFTHGLSQFEGTIYRLGDRKERVKDITFTSPTPTGQSAYFGYRSGFSAPPVVEFDTSALVSGYYLLEANSQSHDPFASPFIVFDKNCEGIHLVASTYTWLAYNPYVKSNYIDNRSWRLKTVENIIDRAWWLYFQISTRLFSANTKLNSVPVYLPYHKPARFANGLLGKDNSRYFMEYPHVELEWAIVDLLESDGLDYCVLDDRSFAQLDFNPDSDMFVFNGHSEYWSDTTLSSLDLLIRQGKKILFPGGNNIFRKVQEYDGGLLVTEQKTSMKETTSRIGNFYNSLGYGTYAPIRILEPDHWVFDGIDEETIGHKTYMAASPNEPGGVSGLETDKRNEFSLQFTRLATGSNPYDGGADLMYRPLGDDGWLISLGSISFASGIFTDSNVRRMFTNIFATYAD